MLFRVSPFGFAAKNRKVNSIGAARERHWFGPYRPSWRWRHVYSAADQKLATMRLNFGISKQARLAEPEAQLAIRALELDSFLADMVHFEKYCLQSVGHHCGWEACFRGLARSDPSRDRTAAKAWHPAAGE